MSLNVPYITNRITYENNLESEEYPLSLWCIQYKRPIVIRYFLIYPYGNIFKESVFSTIQLLRKDKIKTKIKEMNNGGINTNRTGYH